MQRISFHAFTIAARGITRSERQELPSCTHNFHHQCSISPPLSRCSLCASYIYRRMWGGWLLLPTLKSELEAAVDAVAGLISEAEWVETIGRDPQDGLRLGA